MPGQIIIKWLKTSDKKKVLKATKVKKKKKKTRDTQTEKCQSDSRFPVRKNATGKTVQWYVQSTEVRNKPTYLECYPQRKSVWKIIKTKIFSPLVAQTEMQETWVQSLGWEDPLEKEMATHFSTLAWRTPWKEWPGRLLSMRSQRVRYNWPTNTHTDIQRP